MSHISQSEVPSAAKLPAQDQQPAPAARPSAWMLFKVWLALGLQSFGGGTATLFLVRRAVVEQHGWITDATFTRYWAICHITPGIHLLGLTTLIGWRMARAAGVAVSLLGLLLPSVSITIAMTALYASLRDLPVVQAALRGIVPATAALGLLLALRLVQPLLRDARQEGRASLLLSVTLLLGSLVMAGLLQLSVVGVLACAGLVSAGIHWWQAARAAQEEQPAA